MTTDIPKQDEADILAAEYVLGTLPHVDRLAAETRLRRDAHFALAVERWQARLAPLDDQYDDAPLPNLLPKIEARLFGSLPTKKPFWKSWFAGAAVAATLGLAVLAYLPGPTLQPLTTLAAENTDLRYDVTQSGSDLRITRTAGPAAAPGLVHEVWLIAGAAAPVSLGLIDGATLTLAAMGLAPGMVLAISEEPTGGSPTGAPTGPVLVTGVIS
jgi:anti-sigma-K factor RskA